MMHHVQTSWTTSTESADSGYTGKPSSLKGIELFALQECPFRHMGRCPVLENGLQAGKHLLLILQEVMSPCCFTTITNAIIA